MKEKHETVNEHCPHEDCIYRRLLSGSQREDCCMYAALEHQLRGCKISECTRYVKGERIRPRIDVATTITWEYELYDGYDDDAGYTL